jgi:hypothetical protein
MLSSGTNKDVYNPVWLMKRSNPQIHDHTACLIDLYARLFISSGNRGLTSCHYQGTSPAIGLVFCHKQCACKAVMALQLLGLALSVRLQLRCKGPRAMRAKFHVLFPG